MNTRFNSIRLLLASAVLGVFATFTYAESTTPQYGEHLTTEAQFQQLKAGDKVVYVCNECKTSSEVTIKSPAQAMELCKEHATVTCPSCKMKTKVVLKRQREEPISHTEVVYTNDKGEECAFYAKKK